MTVSLRVHEVIEEAADARSIVLEVPPGRARELSYRPGQFLTVRIPSEETGSVARSYSLSSAPCTDLHLKVTVKRTVGGYGSNWLCDNVAVGDQLTVLPPAGRFTPRSLSGEMVLFAAGSGITPMMSILKTVLTRGTASVVLFYAYREASNVIFGDELGLWEQRFRSRLRIVRWCDEQQGLPTLGVITGVAEALPAAEAYLCGPAPFMELAARGLAEVGYGRERVHREVFASLSGNPFVEVTEVGAPGDGRAADGAHRNDDNDDEAAAEVPRAVVHLEGETHEVAWPREKTLVDVLLSKGIDVPYSCRSGECGSCECTVIAGEVSMDDSALLVPEDIAEGFILGCQARPVSGSVEVEF